MKAPHRGYDDPPAQPTSTSRHDAHRLRQDSRDPRRRPCDERFPDYIAGAVPRLAPTSETDSTRYKSALDIATRNALSGEVFPNTMNDGQLQNMT
jgi:hypothetical protein